ncbi:hypothetical protein CMV_022124 [Castanea mollissima]|uniref:RNase H type-1 domain-containing protein n=1 Tax=Castanea mollissima TaxID=60419 RepID=A0A8J4VBX5_9ROSI|nr:hypothetical protein CMV_022124 [Castanea mollissima]
MVAILVGLMGSGFGKFKPFLKSSASSGRSVLAGRGMAVLDSCMLCDEGPENVIHILKDCYTAHELWDSFPPLPTTVFYETNLVDWLRLNCNSTKRYAVANLNWGTVFSFGIWSLWLRRNGVLFRGESPSCNLRKEVTSKATEFTYVGVNGKRTQTRQQISVRWCSLPLHWHKVNSDGSAFGNPGRAGGGDLIRHDKGEWIRGYARAIGCTTKVAAELWALRVVLDCVLL